MAAMDGGLAPSASLASLNGFSGHGDASGSSADFELGLLRAYLTALLPPLLNADIVALNKGIFSEKAGWTQAAAQFARDPSIPVVYINQIRQSIVEQDEREDDPYTYNITSTVSYSPQHVASIALIKRVPTLEADVPLSQQLHLLSLFGPASSLGLPGTGQGTKGSGAGAGTNGRADTSAQGAMILRETPYEALHSVVHHVMAPWFDAYVSSKSIPTATGGDGLAVAAKGGKENDARLGIPMTKKKFAELELSLLHLQQNVEIPEIQLGVHPVVRQTVERCQAEERRITVDAVEPQSILQDSLFLNRLQADVNAWVKEIQTVTKLDRDPASGTASQEINFWLSMEKAQEQIEGQLRSEPVVLTLDILRYAKRFHATTSFLADTGLKDCSERTHGFNLLMRDFPINDLLSATDLDRCADSLLSVFAHLNKKLRISPYPVKKALALVDAISRDLNDTMVKVLGPMRIMYQEYDRFYATLEATSRVFAAWDDGAKEFVSTGRDVIKKRAEKFLPIKVNPVHLKLRERLSYLATFRKTHEQLRAMVSSGKAMTLASTAISAEKQQQTLAGIEMTEEIRAAYDSVKVIDVLDVSQEGTEIWGTAELAYNERVARVENSLIARLRDLLGQAKTARDMLRVLSQFNTLFVRPKVRGAVQEYQQQLLHSVKADIQGLHDKFKAQYQHSEANHMSQLRDLPSIAGAIIWTRQIERQLNIYMRRVEDVLGRGWEQYAEGQKLKNESDGFRRKLDPTPLLQSWLKEIQRRDLNVTGRMFAVLYTRATGKYQLAVNFDSQVITLFKEVRNLLWINLPTPTIPYAINNVAREARRIYPHAVSLMETVRTYNQTNSLVSPQPKIVPLLAALRTEVNSLISKGMSIRWETLKTFDLNRTANYLPGSGATDKMDHKTVAFVRQLASSVSLYQDKANDLIAMQNEMQGLVDELAACPFSFDEFSQRLSKMQQTVDRLNLEGYPNLEEWVADLDAAVENALIERLRTIIALWCSEFAKERRSGDSGLLRDVTNTVGRRGKERVMVTKGSAASRDQVDLATVTHEVRLQNHVIYLEPPLEQARSDWFRQLHAVLSKVCALQRVQSARYELGFQLSEGRHKDVTFTSLLTKLPQGTLERPVALIESKIAELTQYVGKWLQFQSLWDLEAERVFDSLGESLPKWQQLLAEIRKTRATFDNSESQRSFGIAVIDYEQVQSRVNAKYDAWQKDILNKFGSKLRSAMSEMYAIVSKARTDLEQHSIESSSTAATVTFITFVQDLKRSVKKWAPQMEIFSTGQKTLERQRYMFPADWLYVDQVEGEWSAFNEILKRKNASIQEQLAGLQLKITAEDKILEEKITTLVAEWERQKPIQGNLKADAAMSTISSFETRLQRLSDERDLIARAKEALDLEHKADDRLEPISEELRDLKGVWTALSGTWSQISELRDIQWHNVQPRKIRQQLDALLNQTKELPSRMRQYAAFEHVQDVLRTLLKCNILVSDLKSEAMRERHWRSLYKQLKVQAHYTPSTMTLGTVWDLDLKKHENTVKAVLATAQGELALEEYLKQVRETWTNFTLELVNYQNKCRLIKGWDNLFQLAGDNLNALRAMSMSPHYKVFEEEASLWEERLSKISVLFDTWIDVQRQWVYLEGIFSGSAEIRHILPVESSRFQNINTEFLAVMKKVYKSPFILDVLNIPGVQKSLDRLADLLGKIQKALGEYLERERSNFPRFYFVGDEDLLEIIGNSKDVLRVMKHLKKMFAGIATIEVDEDITELRAMASREGETVRFKSPILLKDYTKVNDWLAKIESEMRVSLSYKLSQAYEDLQTFYSAEEGLSPEKFLDWIDVYPAQLVVLTVQIIWTTLVEQTLKAGRALEEPLNIVLRGLDMLADTVLTDVPMLKRRKCEHLITELVHQRDVIRLLMAQQVQDEKDFAWLYQMRFYIDSSITDPLDRLTVQMAQSVFPYGYEYLGVPDRLVQTPLTDRCYLTLTQALNFQLGGAPFGPAGTGKTESVKALGVQLGMFVLVFCCDETFDFQAMGRIFVGLCRVGAWGCFDEFNRLEERILSAVSQQVQTIQHGLSASVSNPNTEVELVGKSVKINPRTGIFITTNPTYAGRSQLPDNLKKLFRNMAMTHPDRELIAQVMLFSQGFRTAEVLASKIVPFFNLCSEQLSPQPHYDFGLRALKSVLVSAGQLKREKLLAGASDADPAQLGQSEQELLIQSVSETIVPKLVADDVPLLTSLLQDVFPSVQYKPAALEKLKEHIAAVCAEQNLVNDGLWLDKVIQLYQIQKISHGLMLVGPSGTGKSLAWRVLLSALEKLEGVEGVSYVIDPKAVSKEALYGTLDQTTREWTDGLFTHVLRKIIDNVRGESAKRHWIIFDGDVDPEWVENLNSVLDDNKLLTLPNGERLNLPPNVRIIFEVEHLKYATLATVSRCGMIWFSDDIVTPSMLYHNYLSNMRSMLLGNDEDDSLGMAKPKRAILSDDSEVPPELQNQRVIADAIAPFFEEQGLVTKSLDFAQSVWHIMDFTVARALNTLFSLLNKTVRNVQEYNQDHADFPLTKEQIESYAVKRLLVAIVWAFAGDSKLDIRAEMGDFISSQAGIDLPPVGPGGSLIDFEVQIAGSEWYPWQTKVPTIEIEMSAVLASDIVIPTMDTVRHEEVLYSWLSEHKPLMLCGPPGSGKTMTLFSALRKLTDMEVVGLNFSSATTPELILKTFEQYCEYRKTPNGVILSPQQIGRWIVVFCDEINLPSTDKYGTQRVISFLRQLVECGGFWRTSDKAWVRLERIQFVGACNPPTDPGRVPLSHRFLRHAPLVMVDYPGEISLNQIYATFNRAMLKVTPNLRGFAEPLTAAMVDFYLASQNEFTPDRQAHYVYSPRELTRWTRGIYAAIQPLDTLNVEGLVRVWAHEGLRLFQDRLVTEEERQWTNQKVDEIAMKHFPTIDQLEALSQPILFSPWMSKHVVSVSRDSLRNYVSARLKLFAEEELDTSLVLFDGVLDLACSIDRILRQRQGHVLMLGLSGSGRTTLSRFVAWINGLSIFQIATSNKYGMAEFDEDLRELLRRVGCNGEKVSFIIDESQVKDPAQLERMNTLLANNEVPGLFEGDNAAALLTACKEGAQRDGLMLDSPEELLKWFSSEISKNLHVTFTMNPPSAGMGSRAAASPALFNRCTLLYCW
ncbi:putative cytoplasmic dynein heavy chain 1 [Tilletiaria anomala UBC 951]|uniref:Dynein heavy chain, cytoplasmic n=1 Tax=Tilletiaria anomala (strain ATCC 24038 / CBS 436.72 / UBC 951) TaxID=1037660 RepID=A0A066WHS9_TILAU|nr:putative cytoplasmic dynein heavy chain 1 [Tilletiaria anomala UBC 951]KDN53572.1 putative cytoplasmic dynein heavy chain 1 [Tilletiaria anomala UBC 951]